MESIAESPEDTYRFSAKKRTPIPTQSARSRFQRTPLGRAESKHKKKRVAKKGRLYTDLSLKEKVAFLKNDKNAYGVRSFLITETEESDSVDSDDYDTELEEEFTPDSPLEGNRKKMYTNACRRAGVVPVSYFLRHMDDEDLSLAYHSLGPRGAQAISYPMQINSSVSSLNLEDNGMDSHGAKYMAKMLEDNVYLNDLNLSGNVIGSAGLVHLKEVLKETIFLKTLNLSGNGFQDKDAIHITDILDNNRYLVELNLSHNELSIDAGVTLKPSIASNDTLEVLDLSWNHLRLNGAQAIAEAVASNEALKCLRLQMNGFAVNGTITLGRALMFNKTLEELDISRNRITTFPLVEFAKTFQHNVTLKTLRIGYNTITFQGTLTILKACKSTVVELLDLTDVLVNKSFYNLVEKIQAERELKVITGGLVQERESYRMRITKLDEKNPLEILLEFMIREDLRLVDLFKSLDKDQSMTVTREEFITGLHNLKTPLSVAQLDTLIEMLDSNHDGEIELSEILAINKRFKDIKAKAVRRILEEKQFKKDKKKADKERAKLIESGELLETPEAALASLAELDQDVDKELEDVMESFLNDSSDEEESNRISSLMRNVERSRNSNVGLGSRESSRKS